MTFSFFSINKLSQSLRFAVTLAVICTPMASSFAVAPGPESVEEVAAENSNLAAVQSLRYGKGFIEAGIYGPAVIQLEQVLDELPQDADANYYMGLAHIGLDQFELALPFLNQAILSNDDYYGAYEQLGLLYLNMGRRDQASALSERLNEKAGSCQSECSDDLLTANASLKAALEGQSTGAVDPAALLLNNKVDVALVYRGAIAEINQGNYRAAIALLQETSAEAGPHPDVMTYLGFAYRKLQSYERAVSYYRQALALDPGHKGANEYLGELYVEIGDLSRAGLQLQKLEVLCPFSCAEKEELQRWISLVD